MSQTPSDSFRLSANSFPDIKDAFDDYARALSKAAKRRGEGAIAAGSLLNGLVLWLLDQKKRDVIALEALELYAQYLKRMAHDAPRQVSDVDLGTYSARKTDRESKDHDVSAKPKSRAPRK